MKGHEKKVHSQFSIWVKFYPYKKVWMVYLTCNVEVEFILITSVWMKDVPNPKYVIFLENDWWLQD